MYAFAIGWEFIFFITSNKRTRVDSRWMTHEYPDRNIMTSAYPICVVIAVREERVNAFNVKQNIFFTRNLFILFYIRFGKMYIDIFFFPRDSDNWKDTNSGEEQRREGIYIWYLFFQHIAPFIFELIQQHVAVLSKTGEKLREDGSSSSLYLEDRWESYLTFF